MSEFSARVCSKPYYCPFVQSDQSASHVAAEQSAEITEVQVESVYFNAQNEDSMIFVTSAVVSDGLV